MHCRRSTAALDSFPLTIPEEEDSLSSASSFSAGQRPRAWTTHGGASPSDSDAGRDPWQAAHAVQCLQEELASCGSGSDGAPVDARDALTAAGHRDTFWLQHMTPPATVTCPARPPAPDREQARVVRTLLSPFIDAVAARRARRRRRTGGRSTAGSVRSLTRRRQRLRRAMTIAAADRAGVLQELQRCGGDGSAAFEFSRRAQLDDEVYECQV